MSRLVATAAVTAFGAAMLVAVVPAGATPAASCTAVPAVFSASGSLRTLSADGKLSSAIPSGDYADLAWTADGTTLYGVPASLAKLDVLDPATGAVSKSLTLVASNPATGKPATAATGLPDGRILVGGGTALYEILPDGRSAASDYSLPAGTTLAGDLVRLPDGDIVAALGDDKIARLHPNGSSVVIGTYPKVSGLAVSGSSLLLATSDGNIRSLGDVPTAASTASLSTTSVLSGGPAYTGATSVQSAGACNVPVAKDLTVSATSGQATAVDLGSLDPGGPAVSIKSATLLDAKGAAQSTLSIDKVGDVTVDGTKVAFTPADGFSGATPALSYRVTNTAGLSGTGTIVFTVAAAATSTSASDSTAGAAATTSDSSGSSGSNSNSASESQATPTAVPAGYDRETGGPWGLLLLAGLVAAGVAALCANLLRTRRQH